MTAQQQEVFDLLVAAMHDRKSDHEVDISLGEAVSRMAGNDEKTKRNAVRGRIPPIRRAILQAAEELGDEYREAAETMKYIDRVRNPARALPPPEPAKRRMVPTKAQVPSAMKPLH